MAPDTPTSHLELVQKEQGRSGKKINSPGVLKHIQDCSINASRQLIEHMFSATDDLFYELSKRATSNNEQNLYFESMREIRIKKEGLILAFLQAQTSGFESLFKPLQQDTAEEQPQPIDEVNLSIVEGDDLEIELALKNMSNRARESYKNEIYELCIRLDHLLLQVAVDEDNNPLDPQQVSKAFVKACVDKLNISIKTRLILFKLFEKHVLKQLGHIYADANQTLVESGILPKVPKNLVRAPARDPGQTQQETAETEVSEDIAQDTAPAAGSADASRFISLTPEALASLMAAIRTTSQQSSAQPYYTYAQNPGPTIAAQELANILASAQSINDDVASQTEPKVVLRSLVSELLKRNNPSQPNALNQPEEDRINLVSMFFDKILEDEGLPLVVQSLICRLQIPVLKVAIKDPTFLSNCEHPARKFINIVTQAGLQFDESKPIERDHLYKHIVDGIQTINRQHTVDESVFSVVGSQLEETIKKETRKTNIVENRTNQTELGKAKIRNAKAFAQSALFDKVKGEKLPNTVSEFLTNTWLQVLVITYIREGKEGALWVENEQLISDLLWLCKSHSDERSLARAQRIKPEVLNRIEKGLELAIDNPEARKSRIDEIESTLDNIVTTGGAGKVEFRSLDDEQKEQLGRADGDQKSWDEMTALERQQSKYEELSGKHYMDAKDIAEGTWIAYQEEDKLLRCKLSKKIDSETYIFVNRIGFKVLEKSRRQFAYDMQFNKAKILDNRPIFDRVLDGIMSLSQGSA